MNAINHTKSPYKDQFFTWFINPTVEQSDIPQAEIQLFSATSLGLIVMGIIVVFANILFPDLDLMNKTMHMDVLLAILGITLAYASGRIGYYTIAVWLLISVCSMVIWVMGIAQKEPLIIHPFIFLLIPIFLTGILHSPVSMVIVASINIIAIALVPTMNTSLTSDYISKVIIELIVMTAFIFVPLALLKDRMLLFTKAHPETLPLREMLDQMPDMVAIHARGKYVYINSAGLRLLKASSSEDILNKPTQQFLHPDYHHSVPAELVRLDQDQQLTFKSTEQYISLDGKTLNVEVLTTQITYEGDIATQVIVKPVVLTEETVETLTTPLDIHAEQFDHLEQRYQHLLRNTSDIMIICNEQGRITFINSTGENILGYTLQELTSKQLNALLAPTRQKEFHTFLQNHSNNSNDIAYLETEFITESGQIIPFEVNVSTITLSNSLTEQVFIIRDLTEQHVAQMVIQQAEERFANIFDNTLVGISITSFEKGIILDVNNTFLELFGYTRNELLGAPILDYEFWTPPENEVNQRLLLEQGYIRQIHHTVPNKAGEPLRTICSLQLINLGGEACVLTFTQDHTEQYLVEQALRVNENRYRAISDLITDFAYALTVDENGLIHLDWMTESFTRMTGYAIADAQSWHDWKKMFHPDDFPSVVQRVKKLIQGEVVTFEARMIAKSGELIWIRDHAYPIWDDEEERVVAIIAATQNITEQHLAEMSLKNHALQQAIISEFGQLALKADTDRDKLFLEGITLTAQVLNIEYCEFLEYDLTHSTLMLRTGIGWEEEQIGRIILDAYDPYIQAMMATPVGVAKLPDTPSPKILKILATQQIKNSIGVMVQGQANPLGILAIHTTKDREFSDDDANFLQAIANVFSAYIEQQRIQETERDQRTFAVAISEIASILTSTLDLDVVLETLLASLEGVVEHDTSSILIIEDDVARVAKHRGFEKYSANSHTLDDVTFSISANKTIRDVVEKRKPIVRYDVHQDPDWVFTANTKWIRGNIAVPIIFGEEVLGIIDVDSEQVGAFSEEDAQRLSAFAHHASIAIRNARRATDLAEQVAERTAELNFEHRKLQSILDTSGEGILLVEDNIIAYVNEALCALTGYHADELVNLRVEHLFDDEESLPSWEMIQQNLPTENIGRYNRKIRRKNEIPFDAGLTISFAQQSEEMDYAVVIIRDISQEQALKDKQKRFLAAATHELRSPIGSLILRLHMLRQQPEKQEYHMTMLEQIVNRTNNLVTRLLELSRFENGVISLSRKEVILQSLTQNIFAQLEPEAQQKNIEFIYKSIDTLLRVLIDPVHIEQVIIILINNAINYTTAGGQITINVTMIPSDNDLSSDSPMAVVSVQDTGMGVDPKNLEAIFQPFTRFANKQVGTGLGLSIAKEIMLLHGGDIRVESTLGEGSTFSIYIPLLPPPKTDD